MLRGTIAILTSLALGVFGGPSADLETSQTTMKGSYVTGSTEYPDTGSIEAIFTPTDPAAWSVVFHFDFQESNYTYSGTAAGSLTDGELQGSVWNEDRERLFGFSGTVKDGRFSGTHSEIERTGAIPTGTLELQTVAEH